jgi:hypothetical protein
MLIPLLLLLLLSSRYLTSCHPGFSGVELSAVRDGCSQAAHVVDIMFICSACGVVRLHTYTTHGTITA